MSKIRVNFVRFGHSNIVYLVSTAGIEGKRRSWFELAEPKVEWMKRKERKKSFAISQQKSNLELFSSFYPFTLAAALASSCNEIDFIREGLKFDHLMILWVVEWRQANSGELARAKGRNWENLQKSTENLERMSELGCRGREWKWK